MAPLSSFPIPTTVDLDFQPHTYVADWCALAATLQNVTGERRRTLALRAWNRHGRRSAIAQHLREDTLASPQRDTFVHADPVARVAGEYLPPYRPGELEIARIVLGTVPQIVYSLRARANLPHHMWTRYGRSKRQPYEEFRALRMVDEHGTVFTLDQATWTNTCTMRELIRVIDNVRASNLETAPSHLPFPEALLLEGIDVRALKNKAHDFICVSSTVYPELHDFYRRRLAWWMRQHFPSSAKSARPPANSLAFTLQEYWREARE